MPRLHDMLGLCEQLHHLGTHVIVQAQKYAVLYI